MGEVYKRSDWNTLLDQVNNLAKSPSPGCTASINPMPHVDPNHIWSWKNDIATVQDTLKIICKDNKFTAHDKWEQSIIDEIIAAIKKGWCNCGHVSGQIVIETVQPAVYSNCPGYSSGEFNVTPLVSGMELPTPPGYYAFGATLIWEWPDGVTPATCICHYDVAYSGDDPNIISTIVPPAMYCSTNTGRTHPPDETGTPNGEAVICGDCTSPTCKNALDAAQARLAGEPTVQLTLVYNYDLWTNR